MGASSEVPMKLSRETWRRLEPLLDEALGLEPGERERWLAGLDATQPDLAPILRKLVATHLKAEREGALETLPGLAPAPPPESAFSAGQRIGPFALARPLGRGGMGEVWLATHADGRMTRSVALKLPAAWLAGEVWRERFRRERDILAKLEHPHIARLYDAGVTDAGQAWLAMEFVEGRSLVDDAQARSLDLAGRIALFRQVLAAVAHAHRHLVVHRDLKPANILVDAAGQSKLLDFGIAKFLDEADAPPDARDLTRLGGRLMTLRYAAPEQAAGEAITTATDIYALGVVLYELLAGASPYAAVREGRAFHEATLLQAEVAAPSAVSPARHLARALSGDLDAILLKALRRKPADRYASVEQFDADLASHLARRPVAARAGTWRYLAGRFVLRHRLPIATAAAVVVSLAAGLVAVDQQRRIAVAERERAARHFASVRSLANTFIFDVHGKIENLAGSLEARRLLLGTALRYLDSLAGESRRDAVLAVEVASGYRRLAEIHGDSRNAHLGEPASARRYAERAAALLEAVGRREPDNLQVLRERRVLALLVGRMRLEAGDASGTESTREGAAIAERLAGLPGATLADRVDHAATLAELAGILAVVSGDLEGAGRHAKRAIGLVEQALAGNPGDSRARAALAYACERAATVIEVGGVAGELPQAVALLERSIEATEAVMRDDATNASHAQTLVKRYNNAARMMLKAGRVDDARALSAKALALVERLLAADPRNVGNASMRAGVLSMASEVEVRGRQFGRAARLAREALAADARLPAEIRAGLIVRENAAGAMTSLATANCALAARAGLPAPERAALVVEARRMRLASRAFKQELVDRGIDAQEAAKAIAALDAGSGRCGPGAARR